MNNDCIDTIKTFFSRIWRKLWPIVKPHLWVISVLVVTVVFSTLPVMISAAVKATAKNLPLIDVFKENILSDAIFIYCSSFMAPLVILSFSFIVKNNGKKYFLYPFALIGGFYVILVGALMHSGVVSRNIYSLGTEQSNVNYPTSADISILLVTFAVWYYCVLKESSNSEDPYNNYEREKEDTFKKFDGVTKQ